jgi:hypothetical protein
MKYPTRPDGTPDVGALADLATKAIADQAKRPWTPPPVRPRISDEERAALVAKVRIVTDRGDVSVSNRGKEITIEDVYSITFNELDQLAQVFGTKDIDIEGAVGGYYGETYTDVTITLP